MWPQLRVGLLSPKGREAVFAMSDIVDLSDQESEQNRSPQPAAAAAPARTVDTDGAGGGIVAVLQVLEAVSVRN